MRFLLLFIFTSLGSVLFSQAPALIPYQAVARDASGQALNGATINARFTILDVAATGSAVWQEVQAVTTSALGVFTAQLGSSVSLNSVNWANGSKFMQVEIDLGQGFVDMGTQQMLSVPYALYAGSVSLNVSATGDTLFVGNGEYVIIPGISASNANGGGTSTAEHTCGTLNVHNADLTYGTMTDQEGNVYKTIVIGTQEWMAENLNTGIYRNGDAIVTDLDNSAWGATTSGAWSYYNNDASYACPYGKLYNWFACTDARGLCPTGWHVPSDAEWTTLTNFLGGLSVAGGPLKSTGTAIDSNGLWTSLNVDATNSSGFSGPPCGYRNGIGIFGAMGVQSYLWCSTQSVAFGGWVRVLFDNNGTVARSSNYKESGYSVRCVRD
jgi:uncharacterized protein (TIGR02145 family)